ncbi:outer membrane protein assembly factor BamD [Flavobacteriaceae bacterium]|nr:outer membrane protein assembly factor BamD [Flavobacteriaceae bacterium]
MFKLKKIMMLLGLVFIMSSCSEFQNVLNKGTVNEQYQLAVKLYEDQEYNKALQLFERILPAYRGKPQLERIQFMVSNSYYNVRDYSLAAYHFNRFTKNYPKSSKVEEAKYLMAMSYYLDSDRYSLDQQTTYEAIDAFQMFINNYPDSDKIEGANEMIKTLQYKVETKAYKIAWQYYHMEKYQAAITSFDTFLEDYLGTSYKEEALYYQFLAYYELGMNSVFEKKEERLNNALKAYTKFQKNYPDSDYLEDMAKLYEVLEEETGITTS